MHLGMGNEVGMSSELGSEHSRRERRESNVIQPVVISIVKNWEACKFPRLKMFSHTHTDISCEALGNIMRRVPENISSRNMRTVFLFQFHAVNLGQSPGQQCELAMQ